MTSFLDFLKKIDLKELLNYTQFWIIVLISCSIFIFLKIKSPYNHLTWVDPFSYIIILSITTLGYQSIRWIVFKMSVKNDLKNLLPAEKECLTPFIHNKETSITLNITSGLTDSLEKKGIIIKGPFGHGVYFDYTLLPWARKILTKKPKLLK